MNPRNFDDLPNANFLCIGNDWPTETDEHYCEALPENKAGSVQITVRLGRQSYTFSLSFPGLSREIDATRRRIAEREQRRVNAELFYLLSNARTSTEKHDFKIRTSAFVGGKQQEMGEKTK